MITQINVENFMRISDVQIKPDGGLVRIEGMNNQGKSSFLKALVATLGDKRAEPKDPIKHGTDKAEVVIHLSVKCKCEGVGTNVPVLDVANMKEVSCHCSQCFDTGFIPKYIVTKTWKGNKSETVLTSSDKKRIYSSPRKLLDEVYVDAGFDVLAFVMMKRKERDDFFTKLIGLDFTEIDSATQGAFEARTSINRDVKNLQAQFDDMLEIPEGTPDDEVSISRLLAHRGEAVRASDSNISIVQNIANAQLDLEGAIERCNAAESAKATASERLQIATNRKPVEHADIDDLTAKIDNAEQTNANVRAKQKRDTAKIDLAEAKGRAAALTEQVDKLRSDRILMIEGAEMPLPELTYDYDEGVMYEGVPYEQASQSDKIMASCALGFKLNPEKIAIVYEGALLDENRKAEIEAFADKENGQIFMEVTSDGSGPVGFVIDDGELVGQDEVSDE